MKDKQHRPSEWERLDQETWDVAKKAGMSRRNFLALMTLRGSSLVLAAGVTCSYFLFGQGRLDMAANSVTPGQTDPINNRYRYKLGKGLVTKTGESEFKQTMSFVPRNLA